MPSTYTVNLGIEKPATGEQSGTWGDTTNINFDILDQAINGCLSLTLASAGTSGSPNTLAISDGATSDGRNKWIEFVDGGDLGATAYVQLTPNDAEKIVFIRNSLSGSRSVILFQGTYDAGRDLEVPAGVDMVVKFSGGGATATTTDVFTKLRATEITTPTLTTDDLTAGTADINDGTVEAVIGGTTPKAGTFTTLTANTNLTINATTTVDGVIDDDTMATASATKLATSESIKAYVDSSVGAQDTLAEILANGNTSGANNLVINSGQALTANTINETTAGSGVTVDSVLLKDDGVNATQIEVTNIKANDGTAAASIANSTGAFTINSFVSNSVDIGGGAIDDTTIGGTTAAGGNFTTVNTTGDVTISGNNLYMLGDTGTGTDTKSLQIGHNRTGDGYSLIDLVTDTTYTDFGLRIIRVNVGANSDSSIQHRGTGDFYINAQDGSNEIIINEAGADTDFRVESDADTHALFVNAGNSRVGVNSSAPTTDLTIAHSANNINPSALTTTNAKELGLYVQSENNSNTTGDIYSGITFAEGYSGIYGYDNGGGAATGLGFFTGNNTAVSEKLAINAIGRTIFTPDASAEFSWNEDGVDADFRVESNAATHMLFVDAGADHVNINTGSDLGGTLNVNGSVVVSYSDPSIATLTIEDTGTSQAGLNLKAGSGVTNRATRINFFNNVTSSSTPRWSILNDYYQNGDNGFWIADSVGNKFLELTSNQAEPGAGSFIINEDSDDINFRVESDINNAAIHVDGSLSVVGINTSNASSYTTSSSLAIKGRDVAMIGNASSGSLATQFRFFNDQGTPYEIAGLKINVGAGQVNRGEWQFLTNNGAGNRQWLDVDYLGNVTFNEGSNDSDFRVESNDHTDAFVVNAGANSVNFFCSGSFSPGGVVNIDNTGNANNALNVKSTTANYAITAVATSSGDIMWISDDGTNRRGSINVSSGGAEYRADNAGTVRLNQNGITFDNGSNYLDDYEEGSWTPTYAASGSGSYNYLQNTGRYVKIGKLVTVTWWTQFDNPTGTLSGDLNMTGLPFTSHASVRASPSFRTYGWASGSNIILGYTSGGTNINWQYYSSGGMSGIASNVPASWINNSGDELGGTLTYEIT